MRHHTLIISEAPRSSHSHMTLFIRIAVALAIAVLCVGTTHAYDFGYYFITNMRPATQTFLRIGPENATHALVYFKPHYLDRHLHEIEDMYAECEPRMRYSSESYLAAITLTNPSNPRCPWRRPGYKGFDDCEVPLDHKVPVIRHRLRITWAAPPGAAPPPHPLRKACPPYDAVWETSHYMGVTPHGEFHHARSLDDFDDMGVADWNAFDIFCRGSGETPCYIEPGE